MSQWISAIQNAKLSCAKVFVKNFNANVNLSEAEILVTTIQIFK